MSTPFDELVAALAPWKACSGGTAGADVRAALAGQLAALCRQRMPGAGFETTGLDPARDRILSIGWVLLHGDRICLRESGHLLVNSGSDSVGHSATVHGLVDADVAARVSLAEAQRFPVISVLLNEFF